MNVTNRDDKKEKHKMMMKKKDQLLKKPVTINRKLPKQSRQTRKNMAVKYLTCYYID